MTSPTVSIQRKLLTQGIGDPSPYFSIGGAIYKGKYVDTIGTDLLFDESKYVPQPSVAPSLDGAEAGGIGAVETAAAAAVAAAAASTSNELQYFTHVTKRLELNRIYARKRNRDEPPSDDATSEGAAGAAGGAGGGSASASASKKKR